LLKTILRDTTMPEHAPQIKKEHGPMTLEERIRRRYKDSLLPRHTSPTTASLQIGATVIHYDDRDGKLSRTMVPNTAKFSPTELSVFASMAKEAMARERIAQEPRQQAAE
jgi:hypothetical protein